MDELTTKQCRTCSEVKPLEDFRADPRYRGGRHHECRGCEAAYGLAWRRRQVAGNTQSAERLRAWKRGDYAAHREQVIAAKLEREATVREAVFDYYGRVCSCPGCGATDGLSIDHVNGDGATHRKKLFGKSDAATNQFYSWLVRNDFPDDPPLQVLCIPCNSSKHRGPACRLDHKADPPVPTGGM